MNSKEEIHASIVFIHNEILVALSSHKKKNEKEKKVRCLSLVSRILVDLYIKICKGVI